jgi:hypothetical protein
MVIAMNKQTYTIKINQSFDCQTYDNKSGRIHHASLSLDNCIPWQDQTWSLFDLSKETDLDERFQLISGQYLYQQVFGDYPLDLNMSLHKQIRIISEHEDINRIPWQLLAKDGDFLVHHNYSIMLSHQAECPDVQLPDLPKILMIMPQAADDEDTRAGNHLEAFMDQLAPRYRLNAHILVVETWADFKRSIQTFQPHMLYYYGHGTCDNDASRLVFCDNQHRRHEISIIDFSNQIENKQDKPPMIAYINCCYGDTGGLIGAGKQLGKFIPAVITNRTEVFIDDAQAQGLSFFRRVLLDGEAPHRAVHRVYQDMSVTNTKWLTPILHCNYDHWHYQPPKPISATIHDKHWREKLDRIKQFSQVKYMTEEMLTNQRPKILCYLWYGAQGQGIEQFHHRLRVELREKLSSSQLIEITPIWPPHFENFPDSCENMFNDAFETNSMYQIPSRIREWGFGKQSLVYIRHMPLTSTKVVTLDILKRYIEWLDHYFLPCLEKDRFFALVGISYVVNNPSKFYRLLEKRKISTMHHNNTVFRILEEMKKLDKQDLYDFLQTHNIKLPYDSKERVLDEIISKTGGHYEQTLYELENMVNRAWAMDEEGGDEIDEEEDEDLGVDD